MQKHVFVIITCILSNLKVTWNFNKDGTFRQHSFVPLPLYHPFITMVKGADRTKQNSSVDKYRQNLFGYIIFETEAGRTLLANQRW